MTERGQIGLRLREIAHRFGGPSALAEKLQISPQQLNDYLTGRRTPGNKMQDRLRTLGCDIEWLMMGTRSGASKTREPSASYIAEIPMAIVPFLGKIVASPDGKEYFDGDVPTGAGVPFFNGNFFALEVENDSLINAPVEIYPGDICIFEAGRQPKSGEIVAVQFKQDNERTVKILRHISRTEVELKSANKFRNYPSRVIRKDQIASFGVFVTKIPLAEEQKKKFGLKI